MTMKIDAAEVAKVFTDLKLPAAFKAYEQQLGDPDAMKLDFGDRVALYSEQNWTAEHKKESSGALKRVESATAWLVSTTLSLLRTEVWMKATCGSWPDANGSLQRNLPGY